MRDSVKAIGTKELARRIRRSGGILGVYPGMADNKMDRIAKVVRKSV